MRHRILIVAAFGLVFAAGCKHKCCKPCGPCGSSLSSASPRPFLPQAPNSPILLPPAGVPTTPAPSGGPLIPSVGPGSSSNFPPPVIGAPTKPPPEVLLPDPIPGTGSSRSAYPNNSGYGVFGPPTKPQSHEPPVTSAKPAATAALTGLPGFVRVKEGVATGRKPTLEGFDSLKSAGYRTVIYLHGGKSDLSAVREVAEKRGLAFVAIETTVEKLPAAIEQFHATLADKAARPAYVCDDDGLHTGTLWYVHFRTVEAMNDDAARVRAKPLGFTETGEEATHLVQAAQRYLETR